MDIISVTPIIYHNAMIYLLANSDDQRINIQWVYPRFRNPRNVYLKEISDWCKIHGIRYKYKFYWRKDYPLAANLWNMYATIRWAVTK